MRHYHTGVRTVKKQTAITKLDFLKTKIVLKLLVLGVFIVVLSLFYIWSRVQIVQIGYDINELKIEQHELNNEHKRLTLELLLLKAPKRIQNIAEKNLGLLPPEIDDIIDISEVMAEKND